MSDLSSWLEKLGLERYQQIFADNGIDLRALPHLNEDDLKEMQVLLGHRRILLAEIDGLKAQARTPSDQTKVPDTEPPVEAERRQVTILFADLAGYTRLSSEVDAEEIHQLLGAFFDSADGIIRAHGGTIDKHLGDCVMAVFGAPVARGNDPVRAVQAALEIHNAMPEVSRNAGYPLKVHIGIASGQVVASGVGNDAHYTVTGDSVNLASRLTDAANAGETLISSQVQLSVSDHFSVEDRGQLSVKGMVEAVQVYLLQNQLKAAAVEAHPFVGRQAEMQQLNGLLEACTQTGSGQVVYLRGEAGIGKTRLTEKINILAAKLGYSCHKALVLDFGMSVDQNVTRSVLKSLLSIPVDAKMDARALAAERVCDGTILSQEQRVFLNELLGVTQEKRLAALYNAMDNRTRHQGKLSVVVDIVKALSRSQALFILVEDIHWAVESELAYISEIAKVLADYPCVLLMTSRFEGDPLDHQWRSAMQDTPLATIDLKPLRHRDAMALAADIFDASSQFALDCIARAEGNPLFLEQLLRSAEEVGEHLVPGSVQSIVQARLDAMQGPDKQAIQIASVLGKRFSLPDLRYMLSDPDYGVEGLIERQLIRPEGKDYLFSHALVQEGVYQSLLKARRAELHQIAAQRYRENEPELCARHLDRASHPDAAGAYLEAAKVQLENLHFDHAITLSERGVELAGDDGLRCELICLKAEALRNLGQTTTSIDAYQAAQPLAQSQQQQCTIWIGLAEGLRIVDRQQDALAALAKAQSIADKLELLSHNAHIHYLRGNLNFMLGNLDGCLEEHQKSLDYAEQTDSAHGRALAFGGLGDAYYLQGHMRSALIQFQACADTCQDHGFGRIEVSNRHMAGWSRIYLMDFAGAHEDALTAIKMASEVSQQRAQVLGLKLAGLIEIELGLFEEAEQHLQQALALAKSISAGNFEAQARVHLARLSAERGQLLEAREYAASAERQVRKIGMAFIGATVLARRAELSEDPQTQNQLLDEARQTLDAGCVSHNHIWVARSAIEVYLKREAWDELEYYATRLETYTADQPLELCDFIIGRGRALAAWGQGVRSDALFERISALHKQAVAAQMVQVLPALEQAIAGF